MPETQKPYQIKHGPNRYIFTGKIYPVFPAPELETFCAMFKTSVGGEDIEGSFTVDVAYSHAMVLCQLMKPVSAYVNLRHIADHLIRAQLDAYSFLVKLPYNVELQLLIDEVRDISISLEYLSEEQLELNTNLTLKQVRAALDGTAGWYLTRALRDYNFAMQSPRETAFCSYRIIETVRQHFQKIFFGDDRKKGWEFLHNEFMLAKDDLQRLKKLADEERHGEPMPLTAEDRAFCLSTAGAAIEAFVKWTSQRQSSIEQHR